LKRYLEIMEEADIIRSYVSFGKNAKSRSRRYTLSDEYLRFYFKYVGPNRETIDESASERLFELLCGNSFDIWIGLAFERFCLKHAQSIARILGFHDKVLRFGPFFDRGDSAFQIDLLYLRSDKLEPVAHRQWVFTIPKRLRVVGFGLWFHFDTAQYML
jgi:AAA+ ATPase superfamily predicted ATPase